MLKAVTSHALGAVFFAKVSGRAKEQKARERRERDKRERLAIATRRLSSQTQVSARLRHRRPGHFLFLFFCRDIFFLFFLAGEGEKRAPRGAQAVLALTRRESPCAYKRGDAVLTPSSGVRRTVVNWGPTRVVGGGGGRLNPRRRFRFFFTPLINLSPISSPAAGALFFTVTQLKK